MKIIKFPHPDLFIPCQPVTVFGAELKIILDGMWDTMIENSGVGLAANQVGILRQMFVMACENEKIYLVNPVIVWASGTPAMQREGCLSAPGEWLVIFDRADAIVVKYQDENGNTFQKRFDEIPAVCAQHEIEHLSGKSFMESKSIAKKTRQKLGKKWGFKK